MAQNDPRAFLVAIARILNDMRIPYLVTGGMSVVVWGRPRFTADVDVFIGIEPHELATFAKELRRIGSHVYIDEDAMREAYAAEGEFSIVDSESGIKADFWIARRADAFSASRLARRVPKVIAEETVYFSSPEDLILSKLLWHRQSPSDRQIEDVRSVLAVSGMVLDRAYLEEWAAKLGVEHELRELMNEMT